MNVDAVFINGTPGVGKSATLQALSALLRDRSSPHAAIDFDYLRLAWPAPADDPFNVRLGLRNLAPVAANYRDAGADRLAVAYVLTRTEDRDAFADALGARRMLVCRLRAEPAVSEARLRERHGTDAPWELPWFLERFRAVQHEQDAVALDDLVIDVGERTPTELAEEVLTAAGW